jgi:hypothetical protein
MQTADGKKPIWLGSEFFINKQQQRLGAQIMANHKWHMKGV